MTPETRAALDEMWAAIKRSNAEDDASMPDTFAALIAMNRARSRLEKFGWKSGVYCPKDGSSFAVIQFGSTGIFAGGYVGTWPDGDIWIADETAAPQACMWKPIDALTDAERTRMNACVEDHKAYIDRLGRTFGSKIA